MHQIVDEACRHLRLALEQQPDATVYESCLVQLMAFQGKQVSAGKQLADVANAFKSAGVECVAQEIITLGRKHAGSGAGKVSVSALLEAVSVGFALPAGPCPKNTTYHTHAHSNTRRYDQKMHRTSSPQKYALGILQSPRPKPRRLLFLRKGTASLWCPPPLRSRDLRPRRGRRARGPRRLRARRDLLKSRGESGFQGDHSTLKSMQRYKQKHLYRHYNQRRN